MKRSIKLLLAGPVLLALALLWIVMTGLVVVAVLPLYAVRAARGSLSYNSRNPWPRSRGAGRTRGTGAAGEAASVFDRTEDVSKLVGCNVRNVQYRWGVFQRALAGEPGGGRPRTALDFGAGSLRDTYELSLMGFCVDALDANPDILARSLGRYDWTAVACRPSVAAGGVEALAATRGAYDVILAFDVIEHLVDVDRAVDLLREKLSPRGRLFVSVPNRLTLMERLNRIEHRGRVRSGIADTTGIPHVNFRSPAEWRRYFTDHGYAVLEHEMAIGAFVNDAWHGLFGIPSRIFLNPIVHRVVRLLDLPYPVDPCGQLFYPRWLMKYVNELDEATKDRLHGRWAWNLFVLKRDDGRAGAERERAGPA